MIGYTLQRFMTQEAVFERDTGTEDQFGGSVVNWQPYLTVPARLFWYRSEGLRSSQREYADQERLVPLQVAGLVVPLGTDVTEEDRLRNVNRPDGTLVVSGPFEIVTVINVEIYTELALLRPHLGA